MTTMKAPFTLSAAAVLLMTSQLSFGAGKHVHGEAELFVAVEGKQVLVELVSPADNLLGFEHQPKTHAQEELVEKVLKQLQDSSQIATLTGGACKQVDAFVESPFGHKEEGHHHEHKEDKKGHDDHKHGEHKHEKKDHHDHGHKEEKHAHDHHGHKEDKHGHDHHDHKEHSDEDTHSEFHVTYTFNCQDTKAVSGLKATAFDNFSGFEEIDLKWVKGDSQGGSELSKKKATAAFK